MITKDLEGVVSAIWDCETCGWRYENFKEFDYGESKAYKHAELGHIVHGEIVTMRRIEGASS